MAWLAVAGPFLQAAGAVVGVGSTIAAGQQAKKQGEMQASQLVAKANEERGIAQRAAAQEKKKSQYVKSRAIALAAASGAGGVEDPTISNIVSDIESEGEIRGLNALYSGESMARTLTGSAIASQIEGRNKSAAANMQAGATLLSSGSSLYQRYGGTGPSSMSIAGKIDAGSPQTIYQRYGSNAQIA